MYKNVNDYELIYLIRNKDDESLNILFDKYSPVVMSIAHKYYNSYRRGDMDDYIQEGFVGLNRAIDSYDESKNVLFYTYACICIKTHIQAYCNKMVAKKVSINYETISLDYYNDGKPLNNIVSDNSVYDQETYMIDYSNMKELTNFKNDLDIEHSAVFELRCNGFKYKEIAELLDITLRTAQCYMQYCKVKLKKCMNDCHFL